MIFERNHCRSRTEDLDLSQRHAGLAPAPIRQRRTALRCRLGPRAVAQGFGLGALDSGQRLRMAVGEIGAIWRWRGQRRGSPLGAESRIDLGPYPACGKLCEPRLGSTGFDLAAELVPPFPNVRFRRRQNRIFDPTMDHGKAPLRPLRLPNQRLLRMQSIRVNTVDKQSLGAFL